MTLKKSGSGFPPLPGGESLKRLLDWRLKLDGVNDGDAIGNLVGMSRFNSPDAGTPGAMLRTIGGLTPVLQHVTADNRRGMLFRPAVGTICVFRPWQNLPFQLDFSDTIAPTTSPAPPTVLCPFPPSWSFMAWVHKVAAGDTTSCKQTFGFGETRSLGPASMTFPRIGLIGDGALGYRFGSVNCPDAFAAGDNAATDIDANSVQPVELINPGNSWFHVRIKLIPPFLGQTGRWAAYLNGRLVAGAVFSQLANLPRGVLAGNVFYDQIEAGIWNQGTVPPPNGTIYYDVRVWAEEDYSV